MIATKNIIVLLLLFMSSSLSWAQSGSDKYNKYFSKDQLSFSLNATQWIKDAHAPTPKILSRGVNFQMMYPIIGNKSNVAFALGFGLSSQNYYLNQYIHTNADSLWFVPIPDTINYNKYKINTNYITLPIELRFRTNPSKETRSSFKIYPGFRMGMMINVHTKYMGTNPDNGEKIKEKWFNLNHISTFDYGVSLRIGYGKFMFHSYYSLSQLVEPGSGPNIKPIEMGIALILF